ncbi:MAG TPA: hypothetical protein VGO47_07405, partial [Chlamydiales bacterium]|nr:hypothetical protein [Chlamydiales bacterium]
ALATKGAFSRSVVQISAKPSTGYFTLKHQVIPKLAQESAFWANFGIDILPYSLEERQEDLRRCLQ